VRRSSANRNTSSGCQWRLRSQRRGTSMRSAAARNTCEGPMGLLVTPYTGARLFVEAFVHPFQRRTVPTADGRTGSRYLRRAIRRDQSASRNADLGEPVVVLNREIDSCRLVLSLCASVFMRADASSAAVWRGAAPLVVPTPVQPNHRASQNHRGPAASVWSAAAALQLGWWPRRWFEMRDGLAVPG